MSKAKKVFEGKHVVVLEREDWQFVERKKGKTAVAVIALTADNKLVLTEQRRLPVGKPVIDWPAGLVGDEDGRNNPAATARKELKEETGFTCARVERLAKGPTSPGITSEIVAFYRAHGLRRIGKGGGLANEKIRVHLVDAGTVREWLKKKEKAGVLIDLKIWRGLYFVVQST